MVVFNLIGDIMVSVFALSGFEFWSNKRLWHRYLLLLL